MPAADATTPRRYANWLEVAFTRDEFVLDFGQQFDEHAPTAHSGIVATPSAAAAFLDTLRRSIAEHRRRFGASGPDTP